MKTILKYFWGIIAMVLVDIICHLLNVYMLKSTMQISDLLTGTWSGMAFISAMDFYKELHKAGI